MIGASEKVKPAVQDHLPDLAFEGLDLDIPSTDAVAIWVRDRTPRFNLAIWGVAFIGLLIAGSVYFGSQEQDLLLTDSPNGELEEQVFAAADVPVLPPTRIRREEIVQDLPELTAMPSIAADSASAAMVKEEVKTAAKAEITPVAPRKKATLRGKALQSSRRK